MTKYQLLYTKWADGSWGVKVVRISDGEVIAVHTGKLSYIEALIKRRGYNK